MKRSIKSWSYSITGVIPGLKNRKCFPALSGSKTVSKPGMKPGEGMIPVELYRRQSHV